MVVTGFVPAGPAFSVRVEDRGRPVAGLPIRLRGDGFTKTAETRGDGTARFENIPPGTYEAGALMDAGIFLGLPIQVTPNGPTRTTIPLTWPGLPPLAAQVLKGSLRWPNLGPDQPSKLQVELLDARTGRPERSAVTTGDGAFDLGKAAPGLYFLRVTSSGPVSEDGARAAGIVPIEVDPKAAALEMELEFSWTSCGMVYVARHSCPRQELRIAGFSGQVLDSSGASIAGATVRLFDTNREMAEELTSGDGGRFGSQKPLEGDYELVVSRPGFTPLRQLVRAIRPGEAAQLTELRIELGVAGSCSLAAVR